MSNATSPSLPSWPEGILVLIPVYNHGATVAAVVRDARALGAPVVVVDDGCSDGSAAAAEQAGATVLHHEHNRGKAQALQTGMRWAWEQGYRHVLSCDADGQHPVSEFATLLRSFQVDRDGLHVGVRDMSVAPRLNRFGRWCSNFAVWMACGQWVGDSQTGLRIYPLDATLRLPIATGHYAWEVEVLVRSAWAHTTIHRCPVQVLYPEDRISHFDKLRDNVRTSYAFTKLIIRRFLPWRRQRLRSLS